MANKRVRVSPGRAGAQGNQDQMRTHGKENTFPLLVLPAELRNDIYHLVLGQGRIVVQITSGDEAKNHLHDAVPTRALTQVCRQIRQETLPIYFNDNKFFIRSEFSRSPQFWTFVIANKYKGPKEMLCLKFWLEKRIPAENLSALKQIALPYGNGCDRDDSYGYRWDTPIAANHFWGSTHSFGSLDHQLGWFAEFLCAGLDQLISSSVLLRPMREATAACIPAPLFDKCIAAFTHLAQEAKADAASNVVRRAKNRKLWRETLAPEEQDLVVNRPDHLREIARLRQGLTMSKKDCA